MKQTTLQQLRSRLYRAERALDAFRYNDWIAFDPAAHPTLDAKQLGDMLDEQELAADLVRIAETKGVAAAMLYRLQHDKP